jgi:HK97 family phage prohead protease
MEKNYDFSGWATRCGVECSDGRTIMPGAFSRNNGKIVPLVWNHNHDDPTRVLGHALIEERDDGYYAYCSFNDTEQGKNARELVKHKDVVALSIYANQLKQKANDVVHGLIREVSLVLAGANPEAYIEDIIEHSEDNGLGAYIWTVSDDAFDMELAHSDEGETTDDTSEGELEHADDTALDDNETVAHAIGRMDANQKKAMEYLMTEMLSAEENEGDDKDEMKQNVFDSDTQNTTNVLSHSDEKHIIERAKKLGSLKEAITEFIGEGNTLAHSIDTTGMETATGTQTYGFNDVSMVLPDYKSLNTPPEFISREMGWVQKVMGSVHRVPFKRIKSMFADITEDEARAKGYIKGNQKKTEVFTTLKRTTDPQTIYKLQKLDRDDILDIEDFSVVSWLNSEMDIMLNEECARAILIGDGRESDARDKISEAHIRPVVTDVPLFNVKVPVAAAANDSDADVSRATINTIIKARKNYKGSGNPTFFTTEDVLTDMLLLEDGIGHKLYKSVAELATTLRVKDIVTVEAMEGYTIPIGNADKPLLGTIVNLNDYDVVGKGDDRKTNFEDFDIEFNQYRYLKETRMSGALVKPFSALTVYLNRSAG